MRPEASREEARFMVDAAGGGGELLFTAAAGSALLVALTAPGRKTPGGNSSTCPNVLLY